MRSHTLPDPQFNHLLLYIARIQPIIVSRFIINLRRADALLDDSDSSTCDTSSNISLPTFRTPLATNLSDLSDAPASLDDAAFSIYASTYFTAVDSDKDQISVCVVDIPSRNGAVV